MTQPQDERPEPELGPDGVPILFGAFEAGRTDASERVEEILTEGFGREE